MEDLPVVQQRNKNFDIQEREYVGELARRSIGKFDETVKLLRFNNHQTSSETYLPKERVWGSSNLV